MYSLVATTALLPPVLSTRPCDITMEPLLTEETMKHVIAVIGAKV